MRWAPATSKGASQNPPLHFSPCSVGRHAVCTRQPSHLDKHAGMQEGVPTHMYTPHTHTHVHTQVLGPQVPPNASWGVELSLISLLITRHHCALSLALTHLPSAQGPQARAGLPLHGPCLWPSQQVTSRTQIP